VARRRWIRVNIDSEHRVLDQPNHQQRSQAHPAITVVRGFRPNRRIPENVFLLVKAALFDGTWNVRYMYTFDF